MKVVTLITTIAAVLPISGCAATTPQSGATNLSSLSSMAGQASALESMGSTATMASSVAGGNSLAGQTPGLVGLLVQQLGVSPQQATGGAVSIFSMAQQTMNPNQFWPS